MRLVPVLPFVLLLAACPPDPKQDTAPPDDTGVEPPVDADQDGFDTTSDCDDGDGSVYPGAPEACNGADDDCDGQADDGVLVSLHPDTDGDGFGAAGVTDDVCAGTAGYTEDGTDCDDADATAFPGAPEACDGVDDDCDGTVDEDLDPGPWYTDLDLDGFGDPLSEQVTCAPPTGAVRDGTDCDDTADAVHPGADEVCNTVDDDCDGSVDVDALDASTWYFDTDGDGFGDADASVVACTNPLGTVESGTDCDDGDEEVHPGATEVCDDDDVDEDCDGLADDADTGLDLAGFSTWYPDADSDGYGDATEPGLLLCDAPTGYLADDSDCDDDDSLSHPGGVETCDGADQDCDGVVDDGAIGSSTWYRDTDGDGYGLSTDSTEACTAPTGYAATPGDCDDSDPALTTDCSVDTGDTGGAGGVDYTGTYTGTGETRVAILGMTDTCTSTDLVVTFDESTRPALRGTGTCSFTGLLASLGPQTFKMDGNFTTEPNVTGNIKVGTYYSDTWTGTFVDDDTLQGSFSGTTTVSGFTADYDGSIEVSR